MMNRGPAAARALVVALVAAVLAPGVVPGPVAGAGGAPALAQSSRDDRIRELEEAIGEASAAEAAALRELAGIRSRRAELDASLTALDAQIGAVEAALATRQREVDQLIAARLELDVRIDEIADRLHDAQTRARASAAALYRSEVGGVPLEVGLLAAPAVHDVAAGTVYLTHVANDRFAAVDELSHLKDTIEELEATAEARRVEAEAARRDAQLRHDELEHLRATQARQRDALADEEARERELVASVQARKDEFAAELATLQTSSNAISEMLAQRQRRQVRADGFRLGHPVPGPVTSGFGPRVHPILGTARMHNGIDMSGSHGSAIRAGADGVVVWSGTRSGYGNTVIVDHGNQYATLYAHASSLEVAEGDQVQAGQTIALVGATGLATGPHLHFEVRRLGVPVNPLRHM